jgi:hypothetical protein
MYLQGTATLRGVTFINNLAQAGTGKARSVAVS